MKHWYMTAALAALLVTGLWWSRPDAGNAASSGDSRPVPASADPADPGKTAGPRESRRPPVDLRRLEEAAAIIDDAVITYEAAGVGSIRPYLLDPDPAIRRAARDGMVQLGEADAVPLLRAAAAKLEDPAEIAALREAADLLALPAWSDSEQAREAVEEIRQNR